MADVRRMAWSVSVRTGSLPKALRKAITKALLFGAMPSPRRRINWESGAKLNLDGQHFK